MSNNNIKFYEVGRPSWDATSIIPVSSEDVVSYSWDDDSEEWIEDSDGDFLGFKVWNGSNYELYIDHEMNCDIFNEIEFEILETKVDFFGTGIDKIVAKYEGEEEIFEHSRWQGDIGYTKHFEEFEEE